MRHIKEQLRCGLQGVVQGFNTVDHVLRPGGDDQESASKPWHKPAAKKSHALDGVRQTILIVCLAGPLYGIAMGSYGWIDGHRSFNAQILQMIYSGVKLPLLIVLTVIVSLPSFFVLNSLFGLRDDFAQALRAVVSAQAGLVVILAAFAPLISFFYVSNATEKSYPHAILVNAFIFGTASVTAQRLLAKWYAPLIKKNVRHKRMMLIWIFIYAFVGTQMGYVLRPFIGSPEVAISFLRENPFENAYVRLWQLVMEVTGVMPL